MLNKYPLVYVEWIDHSAEGGWSHEEDEITDNTLCASVGWLFRETAESIILISSLCEDTKQVGNKQIISRKLIHATRVLRKARNRKQANRSAGSSGAAGAPGDADRIVHGQPGSAAGHDTPSGTGKEHAS